MSTSTDQFKIAGIILALVLNGGALIIWGTEVGSRAKANTTAIVTNVRHIEEMRGDMSKISETLAGLGAKMDFLLVQSAQLVRRLDTEAAGRGGGR